LTLAWRWTRRSANPASTAKGTDRRWHAELARGFYSKTSPPVVAGGVVIVGGSINDNASVLNPA
jgi:glucose dehydrogenase